MIFEPETLYRTVELLATWWVQALALILIGLGAARLVRPASQSMVYRVVIVTVLLCPIFSQVLSSLGMPSLRLPIRPAESSNSSASLIAGQLRDHKIEVDSGLGSSFEATRDSVVPVGEAFESRVSNSGLPTQASPIAARSEVPEDPSEPSQSPAMGFSPIAQQPVNSTMAFLISLLVVWTCGTFVMLMKFVLEVRSSRLLIRQSSPAESAAATECSRAANQLGIARVPKVLINPFLSSPCLIGHWQPVVLLPEDVSRDCYDQVFLHELAHLRRGDWLWNAIGRIAIAMLWPQPLLMWMHRQSQLVAEEVCDDYVLEHGCSREGYLQQLLEIAERSLPQPFASSVSMVGFRSKLGKRAARILDTQRRLSTRVGRLVASLAFMIAFAVTTAVALVGFGRSEVANQSQAERTTEPVSNVQQSSDENATTKNENRPDDSPQTYSGKVLDFNGNPVGGATVLALTHRFDRSTNSYDLTDVLGKVESASDGSFSITFTPKAGDNSLSFESIRAEKDGFGPYQVSSEKLQELAGQKKSEIVLQLSRLKLISGRVIDTEGNPVSGVKVKVVEVVLPVSKKSVDDWITNAKPELLSSRDRIMMSNDDRVRGTEFPGLGTLNRSTEDGKTVETNAQGQFTIEGIGEDSLVRVELSGKAIARRQALVVARDMKTILAFNYRVDDYDYSHYGASPTLVAGSTQPIRGLVKDAKTGSPIANAEVVLVRIGKSAWPRVPVQTTTDAQGSFELLGAPLGGLHRVEVRQSSDQPYFDTAIDLPASADSTPLKCVIELTQTKWIRGRITDEEGKPLIAKINYYPYRNNKNAELYQNFEQQISGSVPDDNVKSDSQGNFRIKAISGPGVLAATIAEHSLQPTFVPAIQDGLLERIGGEQMPKLFNSWSASYFDAMVEVDLASDVTELKQDLVFKRGSISKLVVKHSSSLESIAILGTTFPPHFHERVSLKDSAVEVEGMYPGEARLVVVSTTDRLWGKSLILQGEVPAIDVQLQRNAVVTGRVVDQDSNPVAKVQVNVSPLQEPARDNWDRQIWHATTDSNGLFKVYLPVGVSYRIWTYTSSGPNFTIAVRPVEGGSYDVGDVRDGSDISEQSTAKLKQVTSNVAQPKAEVAVQPIKTESRLAVSGQVQAENGKPAIGAYVAVVATKLDGRSWRYSETLYEGRTDQAGRYQFELADVNSRTHTNAQLICRSDSSAIAWRKMDLEQQQLSLGIIQLGTAQKLKLRLVDLEGNPAKKLAINLHGIIARENKVEQTDSIGFNDLKNGPQAWIAPLQTDDAGEVVLAHIPQQYGVYLKIENSDQFATQEILLNTGLPEERGENDGTYRSIIKNVPDGQAATIPLAPARIFEGTVMLGKTGRPAANAKVEMWASQQEVAGSMISVSTTTDANGWFRINPFDGVRFGLIVHPPQGEPFKVIEQRDIRWKDAETAKALRVELPAGVLAKGKILDAGTGEPIENASVQYMPMLTNSKLNENVITGWQGMRKTNSKGEFEIIVAEGEGWLIVHASDSKYVIHQESNRKLQLGKSGGERVYAHAFVKIQPTEVGAYSVPEVRLSEGKAISIEVTDPDGKPVKEAIALSQIFVSEYSGGIWRGQVHEKVRNGKIEVRCLAAGEVCDLFLLDQQRKLGAVLKLDTNSSQQKVQLQPCGSVDFRMLDMEQQPVQGGSLGLKLVVAPGPNFFSPEERIYKEKMSDEDFIDNIDTINNWNKTTDASGYLKVDGLIPGATYRYVDPNRKVHEIVAKSGEVLHLGDVAKP